jgi:DNA polymerase-3 subunit alpha
MKPKFVEQAAAKGHDAVVLRKYGKIGKLASYAFNKSHSTCYAWMPIKPLI